MAGVEDGIEGHDWTEKLQKTLLKGSEPVSQLKAFCEALSRGRDEGRCIDDVIERASKVHQPALYSKDLPSPFDRYELKERFEVLPAGPDVQWVRLVRVLLIPPHTKGIWTGDAVTDTVCQAVWQWTMWTAEIQGGPADAGSAQAGSAQEFYLDVEMERYQATIEEEMLVHGDTFYSHNEMQRHSAAMTEYTQTHQEIMSRLLAGPSSCTADPQDTGSLSNETARLSVSAGDEGSATSDALPEEFFFKRTSRQCP